MNNIINKKIYLLFLILIGTKFLNLTFFQQIFSPIWAYFTILISWLFYGYQKWGRGKLQYYKKEMKYWIWILIGICSSMLLLYVNIGQTFFHSIWIYRSILATYCCVPVLLAIQYSKKEIIDTLFLFSIIYCIIFILGSIFPKIIIGTSDEMGNIKDLADNDYGYALPGASLIVIPLYAYLNIYNKLKFSSRNYLYKVIFLLTLIFLIQNRSLLFPALFISLILLWKKNSIRILTIIAFIAIFFIPKLNPLAPLFKQTQQEAFSKDYNRSIAYKYFMKENFSSAENIIFGHGIESTHLSKGMKSMKDLSSDGIYTSDTGFLGFMYIHGIIPIIIFIILTVKPLVNWRHYPLYIKLIAMHILICSITISYFIPFHHTIWFIIYYILLSRNESRKISRTKTNIIN